MSLPEFRPAATLILLRDQADGPPEILMVQRGAQLAFAGGNMVFPGGRIDADDHVVAADRQLVVPGDAIDPDDLAARVAAIRETIEETGLAPGVVGIECADDIDALRTALHGGRPFSALLAERALRIDPYSLTPFARWLPMHQVVRRFDTRFYIARAPEIGEAVADGTESSRCCWATAAQHIGAGNIIFPTHRNLERAAQIESYEHALQFCARYPVRTVSPWSEQRDGARWLCIPDDLGYPVTAVLIEEVVSADGVPISPDMARTPE